MASSPVLPLIAIFGPTGVGKTAVAIELAEVLRARGEDPVAISADALQVYEGLEALTGAPSASERARLEHRLIGFVPVSSTFSVGEFMQLAHAEIDAALAAGRSPIVVGGTGLYLRAALSTLDLRPPAPIEVREHWEREMDARGARELHFELRRRAPGLAARVEPTDRSRIIRALELSTPEDRDARAAADLDDPARSQLWSRETRHPTLLIGLVMERSALYRQIDARVDQIVAHGARDEIASTAEHASRTARKALGFQELLNGDVEGMKRRTRNYAKRQLTWMRKLPGVSTIDVSGREPAEIATEIEAQIAPGGPQRSQPAL